jgi:hypothetical protein
MGLEEVLAKLRTDKSVRAAFALEGDPFKEVVKEESSVKESSMGMPMINRALDEVLRRKFTVCIFVEYTFETPVDHIMMMEDGCGNIVGHDVPVCMIDKFKDDPEIVWLCDDFAMYPCKAQTEEMYIVMLPQKIGIVGAAEGAKDVVLLYPATTTDILLRKLFGVSPDDPKIATAILAYDPI